MNRGVVHQFYEQRCDRFRHSSNVDYCSYYKLFIACKKAVIPSIETPITTENLGPMTMSSSETVPLILLLAIFRK